MPVLALLGSGIGMSFAALRGAQVPLLSRWQSRQMPRRQEISDGGCDFPSNQLRPCWQVC
jgi:hypothetical protein